MISGLRRPKTAKCKSRSIMDMGMGTIPMGMGMVVAMGTTPMGMGMVAAMGTGMDMVGMGMVGTIIMGTAGTTTTTESHGFALAARSM
jgi:hypothetical protein